MVIITGRRGFGKSTLALKICLGFEDLEIAKKNYNDGNEKDVDLEKYTSFNMERDLVFTSQELRDLCMSHYKGFFIADEVITAAARRNSMTKGNKAFHSIITVNRKNNNTIFLLLPSIEDLDISLLQYCSLWLHVESRGLAYVMLPNAPSIFGKKTWDIDAMRKIHEKIMEDNPGILSPPAWTFSNFRGYLKFGPLTEKIEQRYLGIANFKKNAEHQEEKIEKKDKLGDEKRSILNTITEKLISGEIYETSDYYKYCGDLGFAKDRLNRQINNSLALAGDGRSFSQIIKENREKNKAKQHDENRIVKLRG